MKNPWKGITGLPKNMWILFFATLINRAGTMVLPFLALYLTKEENISAADAGLIIFFYGAGALVTAPYAGKLSDKFGALKIMRISLIASGIMFFLYPFFHSYWVIIGFTFLLSVISEAFRPANLALIADVVTPRQRKPAYALNRLAINLGMSIGPVAGGLLAAVDFDIIFYVDGATSILAGIFLILTPWDKNISHEDDNTPAPILGRLGVFGDKKMIIFFAASLPMIIVFFQHIGAMPLFLVNELKYSEAEFGIFAVINTVLIILIEVPLNDYLKHWSDKKSMIVGAVLCAVGFGTMAFARDTHTIVATIFIWTFGEMISFPAMANYIADNSPKEKRGEYMGFLQITFSVGFALGPWLGTLIYDGYGSVVLWLSMFIIGMISAVVSTKLTYKPS